MNSRVFIIQNQYRGDPSGNLVPKFDLTPAEKFGTLVHLLTPTARPFNSERVVEELREKLKNFSDNDYLLLIGNPALIGFAVVVASQYNQGRIQLLQWDGVRKMYLEIKANLRATESADSYTDVWNTP